MSSAQQKKILRQQLQQQCQDLSQTKQQQAAQNLAEQFFQFQKQLQTNTASKIGVYYACDYEISLTPLIQQLWQQNIDCYLPIVPAKGKVLQFSRYTAQTRLDNNRYGIAEPSTQLQISAADLELVLLPLRGFDLAGTRLGAGGGYYDASFAFTANNKPQVTQPLLIGIGYELQKCPTLPKDSWDIKLDAIITEQNIYQIK